MIIVCILSCLIILHIFTFYYVDDMLIDIKDMSELNKLKFELFTEFDIKNLRETKKIIAMKI